MVMQMVNVKTARVRRAVCGVILATVATLPMAALADRADEEQLRAEMEAARQQLDEAAQRVAELSRQMAGGEATRVVKRMSLGKRKALLGVRIDDANDGEGVRILSVTSDGPAERAGVEAGDLVQSINGVDLTAGSDSEAIDALLKTLRGLEPGDVAELDVVRDGRSLQLDVTTESVADALPRISAWADGSGNLGQVGEMLENLAIQLPEITADIEIDGNVSQFHFDGGKFEALNDLPKRLEEAMSKLSTKTPIIALLGGATGLSSQFRFAPVTQGLGDYFGVDRGVLLTAVPEDDALGMQEGDVLLSIDGRAVNSRGDVRAAFADAEAGETLAVELVRQRESITLDVVAPEHPWSHGWDCTTEDGEEGERKRCVSNDGRSYSFRFSVDDE